MVKVPATPPNAGCLLEQMEAYMEALQLVEMRKPPDERYFHWDDLQRREPPRA